MSTGDVVKLKSGSPKLIVTATDSMGVQVVWIHSGELKQARFPEACLMLVESLKPEA